nr:MAG TPA: hypothetical protein [Caudoviricetes sp.]
MNKYNSSFLRTLFNYQATQQSPRAFPPFPYPVKP